MVVKVEARLMDGSGRIWELVVPNWDDRRPVPSEGVLGLEPGAGMISCVQPDPDGSTRIILTVDKEIVNVGGQRVQMFSSPGWNLIKGSRT